MSCLFFSPINSLIYRFCPADPNYYIYIRQIRAYIRILNWSLNSRSSFKKQEENVNWLMFSLS